LAPIEVADPGPRAARLHQRDPGAAEVADFAYKAAGVDAIFPGSPFERRFRDMHTLSQQIQAAAPISSRSGRSCSASRPRSFFRA
jgi:hypothetical protein